MTQPVLTVDRMELGRTFTPHRFDLTEQEIATYQRLFGTDGGDPLGLLSVHARLSYATDGPPPGGGVMAGMTVRMHAPLRAGTGYVFTCEIVGREERKGNGWVTFRSELRREATHVATVDITGVWPL